MLIKKMVYKPVVGLEIHIQAKTKTKMFSSVSADYWGKAPNTCVDPVTLGLPGALPTPNEKAIALCVKLSLALNCEINKETKFDRKNYFYPDLPKGYQISQYDKPIGFGGYIDIEVAGKMKKIGITRVHMEEDTGKSIHEGNRTLLDFNKAGVPLIEVVTEPDFTSGAEVEEFAKVMRQIVRYLGVSDADMEKGQMRYELNISLRKPEETELPKYKVEVKNIGSISVLQKVLDFEVIRQAEILDTGKLPIQETRGTRDLSGETHSQRSKENADDYRYFPEPDIPPIEFTDEYIAEIKNTIPKLPREIYLELIELGINPEIADTVATDKQKSDLFSALSADLAKAEQVLAANLIAGKFAELTESGATSFAELEKKIELFRYLLKLRAENKINAPTYDLLTISAISELNSVTEIEQKIAAENLLQQSSADDLTPIIESVIAKEADAKERFKKNPKVAMFFMGEVMKATRGSADPKVVLEIIEKLLQ